MRKKIFVVEAIYALPLPVGQEPHRYVVGVATTLSSASEMSAVEEIWRGGGKYKCEVKEYTVDEIGDDKLEFVMAGGPTW